MNEAKLAFRSDDSARPRCTVLCGNAATGKSSLGRSLSRLWGAAFLDIDTVTESVVQAGLTALGLDPDDRDSPRYKAIFREPIHQSLFRIARENLGHVPVVLVAPFTQERRRADFPEWLEQELGVRPAIVLLHCSESLRAERLRQRGNPRDQGKLMDYATYSSLGLDPAAPSYPHFSLSTEAGLPAELWPLPGVQFFEKF